MNYFLSMSRLLRFDVSSLNRIEVKGRQYFCMLNVAVLGILYGLSAALLSRAALMERSLDTGTVNLFKIIMAGIPVAFLMHAGAALFIWVFLKAVGGKANFLTAYFNLGLSSVALWPLAPVTAALQAGMKTPWLAGVGLGLGIYGCTIGLKVLKETFALSQAKMAIATSVTIVYIGCFLYLWI